jgi:ABC-2 type transport system permease protein
VAIAIPEIYESRELLWNLTLRELRSRYKRSALGWFWSFLNPLATMVIFTIVFGQVLKVKPPVGDPSGVHSYGLYLLCGLLPWNFFSNGVGSSMGGLIGSAGLVRKVWFPREVLVLSAIASLLVTLGIELSLLSVALLVFGAMPLPWLPLLLVYVVLLALFTSGVSLVISAANVYFRDLGYLWQILSQIWFYATPIVYPITLVPESYRRYYNLNPLTLFVETFRDLLYDGHWPSLRTTVYLTVVSLIVFVSGMAIFNRLSRRFAEEL